MAKSKIEKIERPAALNGQGLQAPSDSTGAAAYPNLFACLVPTWEDGKCLRQSGSVRLKLVGGDDAVTLTCPTEQLETTMVTDTLVNLVGLLESHVANGASIWTPTWEVAKKARQAKMK